MNKRKIRKLGEEIVSIFGAVNVECILFHGSILFNPQTPPQDADFVIVLRRKKEDDCSELRRLVTRSRLVQVPIHLHLIYLEELPVNADFFSIHTCGAFFACHLRQAETIYGENIFDKLVGPSDYQLQLSLLQKVQQYTFQLRNLVFKPGKASEGELLWARKKSIVMLKDLLLSSGILIQEEARIIRESMDRFPQFSAEERIFLEELSRPWVSSRSEAKRRHFMSRCLWVHERAYEIMRTRIASTEKCRFLS